MRIYRIRKLPARLILLILIVIVILFNSRMGSRLKNFTFEILTRPFKAFSGGKTYFARVTGLSDENLRLKQRIGALSVELARMKETGRENERLKALLDFEKNLPYTTIAARVIARDPVDWRRAVVINKGKADGITDGMPCATARGLVGVVAEAGSTSSKIMLITDPNSRVGVILEPSREAGLLTGSPGGGCRVIYLSLDGEASAGDSVFTAGFSSFFPKSLAVGKVVATGVEKAKLYRYAVVDPFENMATLEEVVCIDAARR